MKCLHQEVTSDGSIDYFPVVELSGELTMIQFHRLWQVINPGKAEFFYDICNCFVLSTYLEFMHSKVICPLLQ